MVPTIEIISPHGVHAVDLDKDVVRVGSSPSSGIVLDDLPTHCLTIRRADRLVMVTNRMQTTVKLGRKSIQPNASEQWKPGTTLAVTSDVSLRLNKATKPAKKKKGRKLSTAKSEGVNRSWLFAAISAGLLCWWAASKLAVDSSEFDIQQQRVLRILHARQAENDNRAQNKNEIGRIHRFLQIAALERKRENMEDAKQYYKLAEDYALTTFASEEEKEAFQEVLTFLAKARNNS